MPLSWTQAQEIKCVLYHPIITTCWDIQNIGIGMLTWWCNPTNWSTLMLERFWNLGLLGYVSLSYLSWLIAPKTSELQLHPQPSREKVESRIKSKYCWTVCDYIFVSYLGIHTVEKAFEERCWGTVHNSRGHPPGLRIKLPKGPKWLWLSVRVEEKLFPSYMEIAEKSDAGCECQG